ncbi:uncharacterized protein DUF4262 [Mumia flava]|uniref:Uncharacterized protein DUF4262 n=1 Tax=Mumia flava TaxID=1348852 RepID=A0A2M9B701_9ACTN|nr:DUF4262 domain-containing protein [Mumia flava]PJJ53733.1 uncharacterized protein DUF4262 [Mumia flava]
MPSRATKERMALSVRDRIDEFGWAIQHVGDGCDDPTCLNHHVEEEFTFGYTVGLTRYDGHPELIVCGLRAEPAARILNQLGDEVREGRRFVHGDEIALSAPYRGRLIDVADSSRELIWANVLYQPGTSADPGAAARVAGPAEPPSRRARVRALRGAPAAPRALVTHARVPAVRRGAVRCPSSARRAVRKDEDTRHALDG